MRFCAVMVFIVVFSGLTGFQTVADETESENYSYRDRAISLLAPNPVTKGAYLFLVQHRNRVSVDEDPFHDLLGFDGGGLKIGLVLRYGILDDLDIGICRVNGTVESFDVYEFDLRYHILEQKAHFVDLALRPGFTWFSQKDDDDASGGFFQLLIGRHFFDNRLSVGTGLLYHTDSSGAGKTEKDDDYSIAAQAYTEIGFLDDFAWTVEISANMAGYGATHPQLSTAIKYVFHDHTFAIVLSNSQSISADSIVSNTEHDLGEVVLGFLISKELW